MFGPFSSSSFPPRIYYTPITSHTPGRLSCLYEYTNLPSDCGIYLLAQSLSPPGPSASRRPQTYLGTMITYLKGGGSPNKIYSPGSGADGPPSDRLSHGPVKLCCFQPALSSIFITATPAMTVVSATPRSCSVASAARSSPEEDLHDIATIHSSRASRQNSIGRCGFSCPLNPISTPHFIRAYPRP